MGKGFDREANRALAKADELKKEIDVLSQTFERIVDRKNAIIRSLAKDLGEAEEQ